MQSLLVSSKTMVTGWPTFKITTTKPLFLDEATELAALLRRRTPSELQTLMHISAPLSQQTKQRIGAWKASEGSPAWYTFKGDVYKGLKADTFTKADLEFAQVHLGTLSGLYGLVRPLDAISPYRLELGYKLSGPDFTNLYSYWGQKVADSLNPTEPVINLASEEYMKVVRPYLPKEKIVSPNFLQTKNGQPDYQVIHAKIAKGTMAHWIITHRIDDPAKLTLFKEDGYHYQAAISTPLKPAFVRA